MSYEEMDREELIKLLITKGRVIEKLSLEIEELKYYANKDSMTGALNRRSGLEQLSKEFNLAKVNKTNLIMCFVDVDRLKLINDYYGHEEGDKAIITIAEILKKNIRKTDFVIRMGGDEFLVVFPGVPMKEVNKVLCRVCKMMEDINDHRAEYKLSLSYGFFEFNKELESDMSINELIRMADTEMYKKKAEKKKLYNNNIN